VQTNIEVAVIPWTSHALVAAIISVTAITTRLCDIEFEKVVLGAFNFFFGETLFANIEVALFMNIKTCIAVFRTDYVCLLRASPQTLLLLLATEGAVATLTACLKFAKVLVLYAYRVVSEGLFATLFTDVKIADIAAVEVHSLRSLLSSPVLT
jgi:hypothetical protein